MAKNKLNHHYFILYVIVSALVITQFLSFTYLYRSNIALQEGVNGNFSSIKNQFSRFSADVQGKINDLSNALISTESSLKSEINVLKAQTSDDFSGIIDNSVGSVVSIRTDVGQGTGFFVGRQGGESFVVTNAHVLEGGSYAQIIDSNKHLEYATLVGYDSDLDVALLKVDGDYPPLPASDDISVGERVIAIGNPLGLSFSVTEGIISSKDRVVPGYPSTYLQTDVSLNPGNSGGPLIDRDGFVVGINNFKISGAENIGFALPSSSFVPVVNRLSNSTIMIMS